MRIALIGFGTVGQAFIKLLTDKEQILKYKYGMEVEIVAINDLMKGSVMDHAGLDKMELLRLINETGKITDYYGGVKGLNSVDTIIRSNADVVVEATWTNLETGEPGITHIKKALEQRKHVITSNKGPIALAYPTLAILAKKNGVQLRYECTVMSGTPIISIGTESLAGNTITEIRGILNGTTNYILTRMEQGGSYEEALKEAQSLGYAESDPSADVEGWDAVGKTVILANTMMTAKLKPSEVERQGITRITMNDIISAKVQDKTIKLIAHIWREKDKIMAKVSPELVHTVDPLANVTGAMNALTLKTDGLGDITIIGRGAGGVETGHGILSDLLAIHRLTKQSL